MVNGELKGPGGRAILLLIICNAESDSIFAVSWLGGVLLLRELSRATRLETRSDAVCPLGAAEHAEVSPGVLARLVSPSETCICTEAFPGVHSSETTAVNELVGSLELLLVFIFAGDCSCFAIWDLSPCGFLPPRLNLGLWELAVIIKCGSLLVSPQICAIRSSSCSSSGLDF
jgi:hypothetical protein